MRARPPRQADVHMDQVPEQQQHRAAVDDETSATGRRVDQRRRRIGLQFTEPAPRRDVLRHERRHRHRPGVDAQVLVARLALEAQRERGHLQRARLRRRRGTPGIRASARDAGHRIRRRCRARTLRNSSALPRAPGLRHAGLVERETVRDVDRDRARHHVAHQVTEGSRLAARGIEQCGRWRRAGARMRSVPPA